MSILGNIFKSVGIHDVRSHTRSHPDAGRVRVRDYKRRNPRPAVRASSRGHRRG